MGKKNSEADFQKELKEEAREKIIKAYEEANYYKKLYNDFRAFAKHEQKRRAIEFGEWLRDKTIDVYDGRSTMKEHYDRFTNDKK